jgi:hypothetical protein
MNEMKWRIICDQGSTESSFLKDILLPLSEEILSIEEEDPEKDIEEEEKEGKRRRKKNNCSMMESEFFFNYPSTFSSTIDLLISLSWQQKIKLSLHGLNQKKKKLLFSILRRSEESGASKEFL